MGFVPSDSEAARIYNQPKSVISTEWELVLTVPFSDLGITEPPSDKFLKKLVLNYVKQISSFLRSPEIVFDGKYVPRSAMYAGWISANRAYLQKKLAISSVPSFETEVINNFEFFNLYFVAYQKSTNLNELTFMINVSVRDYPLLRTLSTYTESEFERKTILNIYQEELLKAADELVKAIRLSSLI